MKLNDFHKSSRKVIKEMHDQQPCGHVSEPDHEVNMARSDLYQLARYSAKLHDMLQNVSEYQGLDGWQQAKITKAADYISAVYHSLDYDTKFDESKNMVSESNYQRATWTGPDVPATIKQEFDDADKAQEFYDKLTSDPRYSNVNKKEYTHYPYGPGIKYDPENPVTATGYEVTADTNIQAGDKIITNIRQSLEYTISGKGYKDTQGYMYRESDRAYADMPKFKDNDGIRVVNYKFYTNRFQEEAGDLKDACWKGYKAVGLKDKGGRKVPNCVPENTEESQQVQELNLGKTVKRAVTGTDLDSRIAKEIDLADRAFRIGDLETGKNHFARYMRLIKLSQTNQAPQLTDDAQPQNTNQEKIDELFGFGKKKPEPRPSVRREVKPLRVIDKAPTPKFAATTKAMPMINVDNITDEKDWLARWREVNKLQLSMPSADRATITSIQRTKGALLRKAEELGIRVPGVTENKNRKSPGV